MVISDGIPAVPRNRKLSKFVPEHFTEEKTTRNFVPWKKTEANFRNTVLKHFAEEKMQWKVNSKLVFKNNWTSFELRTNHLVVILAVLYNKFFSRTFVPFRASKLIFCGSRNASEWVLSSAEHKKPFRVYSVEFYRNEISVLTLQETM